jgi:MFS family permease
MHAATDHRKLPRHLAIAVFAAFALAYFLSTLVRAVTATLAPALRQEFALSAGDLGLLAGGYFLGFAVMQLPLGGWLDRYGPKKVIICLLSLAVLGCAAFAMAPSFAGLLAARLLCGVGVSACLMAPLTAYRRWFAPEAQLRANSWMLMVGALGMLASTLPVQWLLPLVGWRALFMGLAALMLVAMGVLAWRLPSWELPPGTVTAAATTTTVTAAVTASSTPEPSLQVANTDTPSPAHGYRSIWQHPTFRRHLWLGLVSNGGMLALQTLWAGPWLVQVSGYSPLQAAQGLFGINACMLCTFWCWGLLNPRLAQRGWHADRLITYGMPVALTLLATICLAGSAVQWWTWALFFIASSCMSHAQPAVAMAFAQSLAGRALSAYNLLIFSGVFVVQWGLGLLIDGFQSRGLGTQAAYQAALGVFFVCSLAAYLRFVLDNRVHPDKLSSPAA